MNELLALDKAIFIYINQNATNSFFDFIMPFITNVRNWYIVYVFGLLFLLWKGGVHGRLCALCLMVTVLITDPLNSRVIKEIVNRERPCNTIVETRLLIIKPGGKSFPSTHAVNNGAAAIILGIYYSRFLWLWWGTGLTVAFSRIYVGAHYPLDVIGGWFEGLFFGLIITMVIKKLYHLVKNRKTTEV